MKTPKIMAVVRRIPETTLVISVVVLMLFTSSQILGLHWLASPFLRLAQAFK